MIFATREQHLCRMNVPYPDVGMNPDISIVIKVETPSTLENHGSDNSQGHYNKFTTMSSSQTMMEPRILTLGGQIII